jgi:polar amino acid transport system substrate-binding protein
MKKFLIFVILLVACIGCGKKKVDYGPYTIGRDLSWFPLQIGMRGPNLNAFTNALTKAIARVEKVPLQIVNTSWVQLFQSLEEGRVAGVFTSIAPNAITLDKYTFSDPFLPLGPVLILPYDSENSSLEDLEGKIVSVYQFDDSVLIAQRYPSILIRLYQNKPTVLESLNNGEIDGVLMPILDAQSLVPSLYPSQLKIATPPLNNKALRLITLKDSNQALIKHFNQGLDKIISSGKYQKMLHTFQLD